MPVRKLLIANRGEVAIRIARAAADLEIHTVAVFSEDDATSPHLRRTDEARALPKSGPAAYLDATQIVACAVAAGCDAVHPGYGFLSESAAFAHAVESAGLVFVGPDPQTLALFGDKARARAYVLARAGAEALLAGTDGAATLAQTQAFFAAVRRADPTGAIVIKALAGGGGRGVRVVSDTSEIDAAYARCRSEAQAAFGDDRVYAERFAAHARHIEVQAAGDGSGAIVLFGDRDCTVQRRRQKLIEVAPAPGLSRALRDRLHDTARRLAAGVRLRSLCTFEFLVFADTCAFIEANPRLQVEHTVTEAVTGVDLVRLQLELAGGVSLAARGFADARDVATRGIAVQLRLNAETMTTTGDVVPASGTIDRADFPGGPGVRIDTGVVTGYAPNPRFDSLLAKIVVYEAGDDVTRAYARAQRVLGEVDVRGVATNSTLLGRLVAHPDVVRGAATTTFVDDRVTEFGEAVAADAPLPGEGGMTIVAPLAGRVVSVDVNVGDAVAAGRCVAVLEAMKMEHEVVAATGGVVRQRFVQANEAVAAGAALLELEHADVTGVTDVVDGTARILDGGSEAARGDLSETLDRRARTLDAARPEAVTRRHATGGRTARENVADLCDDGSFVEYGAFVLPAQRRRRAMSELIERYPADGFVCGYGDVNGTIFGAERSRCMVLAYDYTVFAGTQGMMNHKKTDRMLDLAERHTRPIVLFAEGGGGRPGDTDAVGVAGLDVMTFAKYARLSGVMPRVAIVNGRCFAGNAALLGCSDVIIATANATIGMGGPAMIEGGGLGVFAPEDVGPIAMQTANGVVDVAVRDETEAVAVAKRYLGYFQGDLATWTCADQQRLRDVVPVNRLRVYDMRAVLDLIADADSLLELRRAFAPGMITAFARVEGKPLGIVANDPRHLAGAIDANGADKAARFLQLCDAFGVPVLFLCDTPGIMVGPDAERTALVRHASRLFVAAASMRVPVFSIVIRKGYGLGAQAMAGGSFHAGSFTVAWPTGEFGAMGIEGAVRLGFRKELDAITDPAARARLYDEMVATAYADGKALNMASYFEIDDVIDPAESRTWIRNGLRLRDGAETTRTPRRHRTIDTW